MSRRLVGNFFVAVLVVSLVVGARADEYLSAGYAQARDRANMLFQQNRMADALPIYEDLLEATPNDVVLLERCGFLLSFIGDDPEKRSANRQRAKTLLDRAVVLGDRTDLVKIVLESLVAGGDVRYSKDTLTDELMNSAESAFQRGDMQSARTGYLLALQREPQLYVGALYMGDTYFKEGNHALAQTWFRKAIDIDANVETAHRYLGDSLLATGDKDAAREQFIEAVIAEPYGQRPWAGLNNWQRAINKPLKIPTVQPMARVEQDDDGHKSIVIGAGDAQGAGEEALWMLYASGRIAWSEKEFSKAFPDAEKYRHSLAEELAGYRLVFAMSKAESDDLHKMLAKSHQWRTLEQLEANGFLEGYILLFQADQGIAQDYASYKKEHRDSLSQFLDTVVPKP